MPVSHDCDCDGSYRLRGRRLWGVCWPRNWAGDSRTRTIFIRRRMWRRFGGASRSTTTTGGLGLRACARRLLRWIAEKRNFVLACSALKRSYRQELEAGPDVRFVYLKGSAELIARAAALSARSLCRRKDSGQPVRRTGRAGRRRAGGRGDRRNRSDSAADCERDTGEAWLGVESSRPKAGSSMLGPCKPGSIQPVGKLVPAQRVRPQRLKPHGEQDSYRRDKSLRHPKSSAPSSSCAACVEIGSDETGSTENPENYSWKKLPTAWNPPLFPD